MFQITFQFVGRVLAVVLFAAVSVQAQQPDVEPGHYFVAFRGAPTAADVAMLRSQGAAVRRTFAEVRAVEIIGGNVGAVRSNPRVEYVEPVPRRYALGLADSQLAPSLSNGLYGLLTTKAADAHSRGVTGTGINVGVADTGLDYTHPDIAANYRGGIDTVGAGDNDPSWNNDPNETHGTHVAGTIVAVNNTAGVLGVAHAANLYHARVLGPTGGTASDVMQGVRWLIENAGCKVVNLSLGGGLSSRTEENFYKEMRAKGALVVAAAGNDGRKRLSYPAAYTVNISVGAVDLNNTLASFSNTGRGLDLVAPGVGVLSSVPAGQGSEASVSASATHQAFGLEFAGNTNGTTATLVAAGLGRTGEFPADVAGNIALIQRGDISFAEKVTNAMNAGAVAAVIYNNVAGDFTGTLGSATTADGRVWVPAVSVSDASGATLVAQAQSTGTVVNQISSWDHFDGTSMATPHTTGAIALIWSADPALANSTVEQHLFSTATDLGGAGYDTLYGHGIINASAAVAKAGK
ncbi:MAG TPA: S8 family serine peptidase [Vicinamibacterales bacterium]|nr:S8 family serine peptidase [Vicinamibacterales bacterium]